MSAARFRPGIDLPAEQVEANRRYWESEESVNGIAEAMGISKGRLYDHLLPFDAEMPCPSCGAPLAFPHRTARVRGDVACEACGFEGDLEALEVGGAPEGVVPGSTPSGTAPTRSGSSPAGDAPELWSPGAGEAAVGIPTRTVVGVSLVGIATGLLLAGWLRR